MMQIHLDFKEYLGLLGGSSQIRFWQDFSRNVCGPVVLYWEGHKPRWACLDQVDKGRSAGPPSLQLNFRKCLVGCWQDGLPAGVCSLEVRECWEGWQDLTQAWALYSSKWFRVYCLILLPLQTCEVGRAVAVFIAVYKHGDWVQQVCGLSRVHKTIAEPVLSLYQVSKNVEPLRQNYLGSMSKMTHLEVLNRRISGVKVPKSALLLWIPSDSYVYYLFSLAYHS